MALRQPLVQDAATPAESGQYSGQYSGHDEVCPRMTGRSGTPPANRLLKTLTARSRGIGRIRRPATDGAPAFDLTYVRTGPTTHTPTIVIPGGPGLGSILPYRGLRRAAADRGLDLIMVEHRGVGLSRADLAGRSLPFSAMWLTEVVDDLAAVLDHEGVRTAFVAGSSYGSYVASGFGARHPDRVTGMLLDSALQSTGDLELERSLIRELLWDADSPEAAAIRELTSEGADQRHLLGVVRAAYELGGTELLRPLLQRRLRRRRDPVWAALDAYATRDSSTSRLPGIYEFDIVGAIAFRELFYGAPSDGLPLDPALTYAPNADRFPEFSGEPFDLPSLTPQFSWPMVLLAGDRDLRTPPAVARRVAATAQDAVLVEIENGHSALESHPLAWVHVLNRLVAGAQQLLQDETAMIDRLPRQGIAARFPELLAAGLRLEERLTRQA